jgi:tRNA pseudouridine55 synthase
MDGLLLIDKPLGWTSHDVVARVRSILRTVESKRLQVEGFTPGILNLQPATVPPLPKVKVGHTGTLDPAATGLLVLVVGSYCKRAQEYSKLDKTYEVTMCLGQTSTTGDEEGEKAPISSHVPGEEEVKQALKQFSGVIEQVPPAYSAIKVGGKRSYQLARDGKPMELAARTVTIHSIEDVIYDYPTISFTVAVSSGTYIRSLVEDIGAVLDVGAYTTRLRRLTVGRFHVNQAQNVEDLQLDLLMAA